MFDFAEGGSSVDSEKRSRELHPGGRHGTAKTSPDGPSELVMAHSGSQTLIDIDIDMEKLLGHVPIEASGVERLDAKRAVQCTLHGQS
eukprot:283109-Pyramimonas_sp.AAC.1